jgi:hypothetical protein
LYDLNNLFVQERFPVFHREQDMVMNLPCTMVSCVNSSFSIHPVSITTIACSKLQGIFKLNRDLLSRLH